MKGYPLEDLLRIRRIKIDEAQAEVQRLTRLRDEARVLVLKRKDELAEYTVWRLDREQQLYEKIKKKQSGSESLSNTGKRLVDSENRKSVYARPSWMLKMMKLMQTRPWQPGVLPCVR